MFFSDFVQLVDSLECQLEPGRREGKHTLLAMYASVIGMGPLLRVIIMSLFENEGWNVVCLKSRGR